MATGVAVLWCAEHAWDMAEQGIIGTSLLFST
jgi:hypothetical protein